ncbi:unnamed protein product [Ilex paraguariensis]|uniref:Uncharacterized protein n=1 Tax=Ilex paraguariensis TaxID=185542 RepID=A0ABC8UQT2_9AQUA
MIPAPEATMPPLNGPSPSSPHSCSHCAPQNGQLPKVVHSENTLPGQLSISWDSVKAPQFSALTSIPLNNAPTLKISYSL